MLIAIPECVFTTFVILFVFVCVCVCEYLIGSAVQYIRLLTFYTGLVSPQTVLKVSSLAAK